MSHKSRASKANAEEVHWNPEQARKELILAGQINVSLENIAKQFHTSMLLFAMELRMLDHDNRIFSNGYVSKKLLINIDRMIAASKNNSELPKEAFEAYKGDNEAGIAPEHLRGV